MQKKITTLKNLLEKSNKILLINHIRMDLDAVWSLWALYLILNKLWKKLEAINDFEAKKDFEYLWMNHIFKTDLDIEFYDPELIIALDSWSINQLWETYAKNKDIFDKKDFVVIDHHHTNPWYWTLNIIEQGASSTCELLYSILIDLWFEKYIWEKEANLLIAWIITDTNIFYNKNTSANTLFVASKLFEKWANIRENIYENYNKTSWEKTKLKWIIFEKMKKKQDWKIVWAKLKKEDFDKTNTTSDEMSWIIANLINIEWVEIAFLLYELKTWWVKASFRSKNFNIWDFCESFPWWGWHKLAAWFSSEKEIDIIEKEILEKLEKEKL